MNSINFGQLGDKLGSYHFNKLPTLGKLEYLFKSDSLLLKVDQFGIQSLQYKAPVDVFPFKRETREVNSPAKVYFELNGKVYHNFDVISADSFDVEYCPEKAIYTLNFGVLSVKTTLLVLFSKPCLMMNIEFINKSKKDIKLKLMPVTFPFMTDLNQAPWDKVEWYTKTEYDPLKMDEILTTRFSVNAKKEERRYLKTIFSEPLERIELSLENLFSSTKNFTFIPDKMNAKIGNVVVCMEQVISGFKNVTLNSLNSYNFNTIYCINENNLFDEDKYYFNKENIKKEEEKLHKNFDKILSIRSVKTPDEEFNNFVNGFIPLEISWVASLDRGWGTGMRGVRDASNDFMGYISYDKKACKETIENIFSKQEDTGWYPRQVAFDGSDKMDLRRYSDSGCFFMELVYEYICFANDYSILDKKYRYYNSEIEETGYVHLLKGVEYLMNPEQLGEHGLVKLRGGDWLDCLGGVGKLGRAETVMVSAQMILAINQFKKLMSVYMPELDLSKYDEYVSRMKQAISKHSFNKDGFYNAVFGDDGNWYLSEKDIDGFKRVYAPTNSYCLLTDVAPENNEKVLQNLESLKTNYGYKLFSEPFGIKPINGLGKMGTGDFQPYMAENAAVYNHGSQCFYLRALAHLGKYEMFGDVLKFALPLYRYEAETCSAKYAMTNCYQLLPSFEGRSMFSFLTGSIAMIERAIYNWMFGINFEPTALVIEPCIPEKYKDSTVKFKYLTSTIEIEYEGYGNRITYAKLNGNNVEPHSGKLILNKEILKEKNIKIVVGLLK